MIVDQRAHRRPACFNAWSVPTAVAFLRRWQSSDCIALKALRVNDCFWNNDTSVLVNLFLMLNFYVDDSCLSNLNHQLDIGRTAQCLAPSCPATGLAPRTPASQ
jgi:hypothetical protein